MKSNEYSYGSADQSRISALQDDYLQERIRERGIVKPADLTPAQEGIYLWCGDITLLACGALVNTSNSGMTGCYQPCHNCIDNCIHTLCGDSASQFV